MNFRCPVCGAGRLESFVCEGSGGPFEGPHRRCRTLRQPARTRPSAADVSPPNPCPEGQSSKAVKPRPAPAQEEE